MSLIRYDGDDRSDDYTGWRATGLFGETFFLGGGNNVARGFEGDDLIFGEGGNDTFQGDAGNDPVAGGLDDAFTFLGTKAFALGPHQGGQIRYELRDGSTVVQREVTGDGIADMEVALTGVLALRQDALVQDFIL